MDLDSTRETIDKLVSEDMRHMAIEKDDKLILGRIFNLHKHHISRHDNFTNHHTCNVEWSNFFVRNSMQHINYSYIACETNVKPQQKTSKFAYKIIGFRHNFDHF